MSDDIQETPETEAAAAATVVTAAAIDATQTEWTPALHERIYDAVLTALKTAPALQPLHEEAHVHATTPQGYGVVLITRKATPPEMLEAVGKMIAWLQASGYSGAEKVVF